MLKEWAGQAHRRRIFKAAKKDMPKEQSESRLLPGILVSLTPSQPGRRGRPSWHGKMQSRWRMNALSLPRTGRVARSVVLMVRIVLGLACTVALFVGLFQLAGGADWWPAWAYAGILILLHGASSLYLWRKNPEVLKNRGRFGAGTKRWDFVWLAVFGVLFLGSLFVAAFDAGHGGGDMPLLLWPVGLILHCAALLLITSAMAVNPHFEKTVRIQHDRSHRVIDSGPYGRVRHPGYLAVVAMLLAAPLLFLSWWMYPPIVVTSAWLVVRTALEDKTLRAELPGYADYAARVRFRLAPGLW